MAPEQLAGHEVTTRSDIYALGLVLYELFTGKAAFDGNSREEIVRLRRNSTVSKPSSVVRDLDPAVERVILRCLETEPEDRPPSALAVAAALPGGDPLAAALAAGETPSPQMVAEAGEKVGLKPRIALGALAIALLGLIAFYALSAITTVMSRMELPYSTEVLTQKARDMVRQLGYSNAPVDSAVNYSYNDDFLEYLDHEGSAHPNWSDILKGRPAILAYWHRQSPDYLVAAQYKSNLLVPGDVDLDDPPPILSGMVEVSLDPQGRLVHLQAIPPQVNKDSTPSRPYDWAQLFGLAGLDITQFQTAEPIWNSLGASDARAAWMGVWPGTSRPLRVEAASWHGKPIFFQLAGDWTEPQRMPEEEHGSHKKLFEILLVLFLFVLLAGAALVARHNYRQQRSDTQGALRLAAVILILQIATWLCVGHFVPSVGLFGLFVLATSGAIFLASVFCVVYLAIEPYVRRHWPHAIISWSRLLAGRIRDPLVGRDVLYGVILGITWSVIYAISYVADQRIGAAPALPSTQFLLGTRQILGACLLHLTGSIQATLAFFFLMFVFRVVLRKPWLAGLAFIAFWTSLKVYGAHHLWIEIPVQIAVYAVAAIVALRFGFIALAVGILVADLLLNVPITTNVSSWYAGSSIFVVLLVVAMAVWGAYTALAGQKVWQHQLFE
jgi:serine/threonine-protein kinase